MIGEPSNEQRAEWARTAVEEHAKQTRSSSEPISDKIHDLVVNLMHLSKEEELDLTQVVEKADLMYQLEVDAAEDDDSQE